MKRVVGISLNVHTGEDLKEICVVKKKYNDCSVDDTEYSLINNLTIDSGENKVLFTIV